MAWALIWMPGAPGTHRANVPPQSTFCSLGAFCRFICTFAGMPHFVSTNGKRGKVCLPPICVDSTYSGCNEEFEPCLVSDSANPHCVSDPLPQSFVGSS